MTNQSKTKTGPQDFTEAGNGLAPDQKRNLDRVIGRIGKSAMQDYRGGRSYQRLPGDA